MQWLRLFSLLLPALSLGIVCWGCYFCFQSCRRCYYRIWTRGMSVDAHPAPPSTSIVADARLPSSIVATSASFLPMPSATHLLKPTPTKQEASSFFLEFFSFFIHMEVLRWSLRASIILLLPVAIWCIWMYPDNTRPFRILEQCAATVLVINGAVILIGYFFWRPMKLFWVVVTVGGAIIVVLLIWEVVINSTQAIQCVATVGILHMSYLAIDSLQIKK